MNTKETRDEITTGATGRQPDTPEEDGRLTLDTYPSYDRGYNNIIEKYMTAKLCYWITKPDCRYTAASA